MENLEQFKKDFKQHLEDTWNASNEDSAIKRFDETEKTVKSYITNYFEGVKVRKQQDDKVTAEAQIVLDGFRDSKIKLI